MMTASGSKRAMHGRRQQKSVAMDSDARLEREKKRSWDVTDNGVMKVRSWFGASSGLLLQIEPRNDVC